MRIIVLPKIGMERYTSLFPKESSINHIIISINSYGCPKAVLPIIHGCNDAKECLKGSLFLTFDDIFPVILYEYNKENKDTKINSSHLFSVSQAQDILTFVRKNINLSNIESIFINCEAGVSRSSAIALALDVSLNKVQYKSSLFYNSKKYLPNKFIFRTIISTYKNSYY